MHEGYTEQYTERTTQRTGTNLNTCKLQPELRLSEDSSAWVGGRQDKMNSAGTGGHPTYCVTWICPSAAQE